jgi:hypothetical protein
MHRPLVLCAQHERDLGGVSPPVSGHSKRSGREAERNCMGATRCGKESQSETASRWTRTGYETVPSRASGHPTATLSWSTLWRRKSGGCAGKDRVLTWGDLASSIVSRGRAVHQKPWQTGRAERGRDDVLPGIGRDEARLARQESEGFVTAAGRYRPSPVRRAQTPQVWRRHAGNVRCRTDRRCQTRARSDRRLVDGT